jgi:5'-AMP-activated protein kinase regulatory gamma subunit
MTTKKNETTTTPQRRRDVGHIRSVLASTTLRSMLSQIDRAKQGSLAGAGSFVVSLGHDDTCETALNTLKRYNVLSAPVLLQNVGLNREDERATCLGFFSVSDVIDPLVEAFEDEKKLEKMEDPINMLQAMSLLRKVAPEVFSKKIIQIGNLSDVDLVFEPYAKELSILEAMENFLANQHHLVHRLGVFDPHGEIHRIISQSDIIKFLQMKNEQGVFKELSRLTVQDCGFCSSERALGLCCVEPHELTINVLKKLRDRDISCVGVVYEDVLIANFSASDLRRVTKDHVSILGLPIAEFLALSHRTSYGGYSHIESQHVSHAFFQKMNEDSPTAVDRRDKAIEKDEIFLQTVGVSATISDVLNALTYVHRVWVVVEKPKLNAGKPLDVITLTDVLRLFISEENDAFGEENK